MLGLMQDYQLTVQTILDHAALNHGEREMVTRSIEGPIRRYTYKALRTRALRVAKALQKEGVGIGDRIATMAWNTDRHVEVWYGIMGLGAISHTVNPRLFAEQLIYIMNHAEDKILFVDLTFVPVIEAIAAKLPTIKKYIILTDEQHMPEIWTALIAMLLIKYLQFKSKFNWSLSNLVAFLRWNLFTYRNLWHWIDRPFDVLPIVPMFHANAWAITFAIPAAGASMVMPGAGMDGKSIYELLESERVSTSAAVPTVWLGLLQYLANNDLKLPYLNRVLIGGAACPRMMIETLENKYDVEVIHGWGMTEMSPVGTTSKLKYATRNLKGEELVKLKLKQGRTPYMVEMKIVDDDHNDLPRDGTTSGHLLVRGPAISSGYYKREENVLDEDGWFDTGDIAKIGPLGYMQITDRDKDVIKSGGEWISSIEIENTAVGCEGVAEAAVIGVAHPKWTERPLLIIVRTPDSDVSAADIQAYLKGKIADWWMPEAVEFIDEIPHTATGKIQKMALREQFGGYRF